MHQDATNDIRSDIVAGVSQVALVVDGRAADVPADLAVLLGNKGDGKAGVQRVMKLERSHGGSRAESVEAENGSRRGEYRAS